MRSFCDEETDLNVTKEVAPESHSFCIPVRGGELRDSAMECCRVGSVWSDNQEEAYGQKPEKPIAVFPPTSSTGNETGTQFIMINGYLTEKIEYDILNSYFAAAYFSDSHSTAKEFNLIIHGMMAYPDQRDHYTNELRKMKDRLFMTFVIHMVEVVENKFPVNSTQSKRKRAEMLKARFNEYRGGFRVNQDGYLVVPKSTFEEYNIPFFDCQVIFEKSQIAVAEAAIEIQQVPRTNYDLGLYNKHPHTGVAIFSETKFLAYPRQWAQREEIPSCIEFREKVELDRFKNAHLQDICEKVGSQSYPTVVFMMCVVLRDLYDRLYFKKEAHLHNLSNALNIFVTTKAKMPRFNQQGFYKESNGILGKAIMWKKVIVCNLNFLLNAFCDVKGDRDIFIALEKIEKEPWRRHFPVLPKLVDRQKKEKLFKGKADFEAQMIHIGSSFAKQFGSAVVNTTANVAGAAVGKVIGTTSVQAATDAAMASAVGSDLVKDAVEKTAYDVIKKMVYSSLQSVAGFLEKPLQWAMDLIKTVKEQVCKLVHDAYGAVIADGGKKFLIVFFALLIVAACISTIVVSVKLVRVLSQVFNLLFEGSASASALLQSFFCETGMIQSQSFFTTSATLLASCCTVAAAFTSVRSLSSMNYVVNMLMKFPDAFTALEEGYPKLIEWVFCCWHGIPAENLSQLDKLRIVVGNAQEFCDITNIDSLILTDPEYTARVCTLYDEMIPFRAYFYENRNVFVQLARDFSLLMLHVQQMRNSALAKSESAMNRIETAAFWIYGGVGVGKNEMITTIQKQLWLLLQARYGKNQYPDFNNNTVFNRVKNSAFWEMYTNQKFSTHHEVLQEASDTLTITFVMEFLSMCETSPYLLNMAFEGKGQVSYVGEACFITSNLPLQEDTLKTVGIRYPTAMIRRMTFPLELIRNRSCDLKSDLSNIDQSWSFVLNAHEIPDVHRAAYLQGVSDYLPGAKEAIEDKKKIHYKYSTVLAAFFQEIVYRKEKKPFAASVGLTDWCEFIEKELPFDLVSTFPAKYCLEASLDRIEKFETDQKSEIYVAPVFDFESQGRHDRMVGFKEFKYRMDYLQRSYEEHCVKGMFYKERDEFIWRALRKYAFDGQRRTFPNFFLELYVMIKDGKSRKNGFSEKEVWQGAMERIIEGNVQYDEIQLSADEGLFPSLSFVNEFRHMFEMTNGRPVFLRTEYEPVQVRNWYRKIEKDLFYGYDTADQINHCYAYSLEILKEMSGFNLIRWHYGRGMTIVPETMVESDTISHLFSRFHLSFMSCFDSAKESCVYFLKMTGLDGFGDSSLDSNLASLSIVVTVLVLISATVSIVTGLMRYFRKEEEQHPELRMLVEALELAGIEREDEEIVVSQNSGIKNFLWRQASTLEFRKGDIIGVQRNIRGIFEYYHVGVVVKDDLMSEDSIIHFSGEIHQKIGARICSCSLNEFLLSSPLENIYICDIDRSICRERDQVVESAKARLGEKGYHALRNNCEHFAFECKTGVSRSPQAMDLISRICASQSFNQAARMKNGGVYTAHTFDQNARMKKGAVYQAHNVEVSDTKVERLAHITAQALENCFNRLVDVSSNTHVVKIRGRYTSETIGLFVYGRTCVIPSHAWNSITEKLTIEVCNKVGELQFPFRAELVGARELLGRDLVVLTFPSTMPEKRNLIKHMRSRGKVYQSPYGIVRVETATESARHHTIAVTGVNMMARSDSRTSYLNGPEGDLITNLNEYLTVDNCVGKVGDCGTGYVSTDVNDADWLVGIHIGGVGKQSVVGPFYKEDFAFVAQSSFEPHIPEFIMENIDIGVEPVGVVPRGSQFLGVAKVAVSGSIEPSHYPSVFQLGTIDIPPIFEVNTAPTRLRRFRNAKWELIDPFEMAANKMQGTKAPVPKIIEQMVEDQPHLIWAGVCPEPNRKLRRLTFRESLFGCPDLGINSFDPKTSSSYRGRVERWKRCDLFDLQSGTYDPYLEEMVMYIISLFEKGKIYYNVSEFCLKPELREWLRVMLGKTRGFHVGDIAIALATKMIFGDLVQFLKDSRHSGTGCIGTNVHGFDWKMIFDELNFAPDIDWLEMDVEGFDTTVQPWAGTMIGKFAAHMYRYVVNSPDWFAVMSAAKASVGCIMVVGRNVVRLDHMNPSGSWMTGTTNTLLSHFMDNIFF